MDKGGAKKELEPKINNFGSTTLIFSTVFFLRTASSLGWGRLGWLFYAAIRGIHIAHTLRHLPASATAVECHDGALVINL